jgi:hypothetical protein
MVEESFYDEEILPLTEGGMGFLSSMDEASSVEEEAAVD